MQFMETLDKFDVAILMQLQSDARQTNAELASRVGLSAAPCWRRVRALEEAGFITGYRAEINRHKIGLGSTPTATAQIQPENWKKPSKKCLKSSPATTSAAPAPLSCKWWRKTWKPSASSP
jgi:DNA-binding Lrp family transcriptional regulator